MDNMLIWGPGARVRGALAPGVLNRQAPLAPFDASKSIMLALPAFARPLLGSENQGKWPLMTIILETDGLWRLQNGARLRMRVNPH